MNFLGRPQVMIGGAVLALATIGFTLVQVLRDIVLVFLILVILALTVALILMWLRQRKAAAAAEEIETTITKQADQDIERSTPGQAKELEDLKAELLAAIRSLKSSKHGQGALSTVPWYLLLGPADSGKGTLVKQSGLSFPLTDDHGGEARSIRGVGGTRTLEWWLSREAVLLEMPGRLLATAEFEDDSDWVSFLGVLKSQRPKHPINGVIVPVALGQVADRSDAEIDKLGQRLRGRVQELIQHLEVTFPTYVVFTGCDQVAGFAEFFSEYDAEKRTQPWGATIAVADALEQPAEALFETEHRELVGALRGRWLERAPRLPDDEQRGRLFAFPLQLERTRPYLSRFMRSFFDGNGSVESPLFRGFYFTSAAPQGGGVDRVFRAAAGTVGLVPDLAPAPPPPGGPWFLQQLFTRVIFPDRELVTDSTAAIEQRRRARIVLASVLGFALLVTGVLFSSISCSNNRLVDHTLKAATLVKRVGANGTFEARVTALDSLRSQISKLEALQMHTPWWRHLGGYWGHRLIEPALGLYTERTLTGLVRPAMPRIEAQLSSMTATEGTPFVGVFYTYVAWRLLQKPEGVAAGEAGVIGQAVRRGLAGEIDGVGIDRRAEVAQMVERDVRFLAEHENVINQSRGLYALPDQGLMERSATWLRAHWDGRQFYDLMVRQAGSRAAPMRIEALAGKNNDLFHAASAVPGPFTLQGWNQEIRPRIAWFRDRMSESWMIEDFGDLARNVPGDLERTYASQYSAEWERFLSGVTANQAPSWQTAVGKLNTAAAPTSPLFTLLAATGRETALPADTASAVRQVADDYALFHGFEVGGAASGAKPGFFARIGRFFGLGRKQGEFDPGASDKERYRKLLADLMAKVGPLAQANAASKDYDALFLSTAEAASPIAAFSSFARDLQRRYPKRGTDPGLQVLWLPLRMLPRDVVGPPSGSSDDLSNETDDAQSGGGGGGGGGGQMPPDVGEAWAATVVAPFQANLAGKYPLAGGSDASIASFADFFKPGGTFWRFYDEKLKNKLTEDGRALPGAEGLVSPELAKAVSQARDIREALFAGGAQPQVRFRVRAEPAEPVQKPAPLFYWSEIEIDGQALHYAPGAATWTDYWTWPGPQPGAGAAARANAGGKVMEQRIPEGPWSLFRLLDRAQIRSEETSANVTFRISSGGITWNVPFELEPQGGNPRHPFRKDFLRFTLPASI